MTTSRLHQLSALGPELSALGPECLVRFLSREELTGPETISTMPEETIPAFQDHGRFERRLESDLDEAHYLFNKLYARASTTTTSSRRSSARRTTSFSQRIFASRRAHDFSRVGLMRLLPPVRNVVP
jgi:hypothetical protein